VPPRFVLFGPDHLAALAVTALAAAGLSLLARRHARGRAGAALRAALAAALVAATAATLLAWSREFPLTVWDVLPLHLCDFLILVAAFALVTRHQAAYELLYFWGCAGTLIALFSPDVHAGFPSWRFLSFFVLHGLVVIAAVVLTLGFGMRPGKGAPWRALLVTNAYAAAVGLVNVAFDTNFLYLQRKPGAPTLLDWLGPWPVYILVADALAAVMFWLLYWPFRSAQARESAQVAPTGPGG
jgi:hypothetical integral membrane protein (TIGR02206 family)